jgi:hypothetical protein
VEENAKRDAVPSFRLLARIVRISFIDVRPFVQIEARVDRTMAPWCHPPVLCIQGMNGRALIAAYDRPQLLQGQRARRSCLPITRIRLAEGRDHPMYRDD